MRNLPGSMHSFEALMLLLVIGLVPFAEISRAEVQSSGALSNVPRLKVQSVALLADLVKADAFAGIVSFESGTQEVWQQRAKIIQVAPGERGGVPDGPIFKVIVPTTNYLPKGPGERGPLEFKVDGVFSSVKVFNGKSPAMGKISTVLPDPNRRYRPFRELALAVDWSQPLNHPLFFVAVAPSGSTSVLDCTLFGPVEKSEITDIQSLVKMLLIDKPVTAQEERARLTNTNAFLAMVGLLRLEQMKEAKPQDYALAATASAPAYSASFLRMGLKAAMRNDPFTNTFLGDLKARFAELDGNRKAALVADMRLYLKEGYPPLSAALKKGFADELAVPPTKAGETGNTVEPGKQPDPQKPTS